MKSLLPLLLLFPAGVTAQEVASVKPNMELVSSGVSKVIPPVRTISDDDPDVVHGVDPNARKGQDINMLDPSRITSDKKTAIERSAELDRRSAELQKVEVDAARSAIKSNVFYRYRIKLKNTDTRSVERFVWQFESRVEGSEEVTARQFVCGQRIKPNETREFVIETFFPPSGVLSVSKNGNNSEKNSASVDRIEYQDGSFWQKPEWDSARYSHPLDSGRDLSAKGRCVVL
jgi:hypothetical protein